MPTADNARAKILRAALTVLGAEGPAAVSNRKIGKTAGVSLGSLTYHFDTQDALLQDALELFVTEEVERLGELSALLGDGSLAEDEAIDALESVLRGRTEMRIAKMHLYEHAIHHPGIRGAVRDCFDTYDRLARRALEAMGVPDADAVAPLVVAIIDGIQLRRLATGADTLSITEPLRRLLHGLRQGR